MIEAPELLKNVIAVGVATPEKPAATTVSVEDIKRVVAYLKGPNPTSNALRGIPMVSMAHIAERLGVKRGTLDSWLRGDTKPGAKATDVLLTLMLELPPTHDEKMRIRGRARMAIYRGEVDIVHVSSLETAKSLVESESADAWGEHEPEQYRFWGMDVHGPRQYVTFRFHDRELVVDMAKPGVSAF